jgi:hypothetical protein
VETLKQPEVASFSQDASLQLVTGIDHLEQSIRQLGAMLATLSTHVQSVLVRFLCFPRFASFFWRIYHVQDLHMSCRVNIDAHIKRDAFIILSLSTAQ